MDSDQLLAGALGSTVCLFVLTRGVAEGGVEVNIEIKDPEAIDAVIETVAKFDNLDWLASGVHWDALTDLSERTGAEVFPLSLGVAENGARLIERYRDQLTDEQALKIGAVGLSIYEVGLTPDIIAATHAAGLEVWVWTIDDPARALK